MAQSYNPATGGYWDGAGNPGLYNLVELEMANRHSWASLNENLAAEEH